MTDLCYEPAHRLAVMLRERKVSAAELLGQFEARLAKVNPAINAVVATNFDAARERARAADAAIARGEWWGPLHGLPMTIKDSYEVAGMPAVCGAPALKEHRPQRSAVAAQRLIDAGAVVFGKTNTPLYASDIQTFNPVFGTTRNPWNPERTPGGSSGGAAAALAAGLAPLELGSDLGGSVRIPAHYCGVFGHKPSYRLVPTRGSLLGPPGVVMEPDLLVAGPMARCAEDLALALRLIAGPAAPEATAWRVELPPPRRTQLAGFRVRAWIDDPFCPLDPTVRIVLEAALERLAAAGALIERGAPPGFALEEIYERFSTLIGAAMSATLPRKVYRRARAAGALAHWLGRDRPNTMAGALRRLTVSHADWLRAHERRERLRLKFEEFFEATDVLLMPVTAVAAPPHNQSGNLYQRTITVGGRTEPYASQFVWISPATVAGLPATAMPAGLTADGLPVGLQVVGAHLADLTTIEFARLASEVLGGFVPPP